MSKSAKELVSEIALLLVMTSEGDNEGKKLLLDQCREVAAAAKAATPPDEEIAAAAEFVLNKAEDPQLLPILSEFCRISQQHFDGLQSSETPIQAIRKCSTTKTSATESTDFAADIDQRFLIEYIETHSLQLEEFEASLIEQQSGAKDEDEFIKGVKRYLHSLKGDSGSIGLLGVEKVCHALEDRIATVDTLQPHLPALFAFKEWAIKTMRSLADGEQPEELAAAFLSRIDPTRTAQASPATGQPRTKTPAKKEVESYALTGETEILIEFAAEAEEHLNNSENILINSDGPLARDTIDTLFRGVHSIKGGSAYFNLQEMMRCSHILENYLAECRDGKRQMGSTLTSLMLTYIDLQKDVLTRARQAISGDRQMATSPASLQFLASLEAYGKGKLAEVASQRVKEAQESTVQENVIQEAPSRESSSSEGKTEQLNVKNFVKVDTTRLDLLIDSIGEMVIYSSMLIRHCRELLQDREEVMEAAHRVEKFSRDLQDIGMSMRLVPVKGLFQKMARLVWDTSRKLNKEIDFVMSGEDTELDRNLIDKLADPLMHMVRNALDHAIEPPNERESKGKPRRGTVSLTASHSGGSIQIQIKDDGRGLNPEKIFNKAVEKGIISPDSKLSREKIFELIFAPGFSTAAVVTDLSGRGVGMDVVRRNVESLRGRVHISSEIDKGSTFTIEFPLTLAIIDGIDVRVGRDHFILPSLTIVEFLRPKPEMVSSALDVAETFYFRGKYLPLFRVAELYQIDADHTNPVDAAIVVVETGNEQVALMVDDIVGEYSTVIKNLGPMFKEGIGFAGCAIMPGGEVALILDVRTLVQYARTNYAYERLDAPQDASVMH